MDYIKSLQQMIDNSNNIVFFGGAGVSTESGIPDFRSQSGIYHQQYKYPPETILSHSFYLEHTEEFFEFYRKKMIFPEAKPNKAHEKLAELDKAGKLKAVVTQNIDGLHQKAGSKTVFELHGSVHRNYCTRCGKFFDLNFILNHAGIPTCDCGGTIKPDVVLYEEALDQNIIQNAISSISKADVFIVGGSSLAVYPAADLIHYFRGKKFVLINRSETLQDVRTDLSIQGSIGEVLSHISV
ncbi:MAG: NAD-dependent protein deacylase [Clostridiales bacterium]|nr:NAD-dependent protein deacylase [Clostridiales bacterium]